MLRRTVRVKLPAGMQDEDLPDFVSTTVDSYYGALDPHLDDEDKTVPVRDIRVTSVALSDDAVAVNYKVGARQTSNHTDWPGLDGETGADRVVLGERRGGFLIFERFIPARLRRKS